MLAADTEAKAAPRKSAAMSPSRRMLMVVVLVFFVPAVALAVYMNKGNPTFPNRPYADRADERLAAQQLDQLVDRLRVAGAQIPGFADLVGLGGRQERLCHVGHEQEVAGLGSVADHGERLAGDLLAQEHAEHRPIGARGPRPRTIGIEDPHRVHRQTVDLMPMERRLLALVLGERIRILRTDRVVLAGRRIRQPVAGRRRGIDQLAQAGVARRLEHPGGALDVHFHVLQRPLDRRHDVADAGEVEHVARAREGVVVGRQGPDVTEVADQVRAVAVMGQVEFAAAAQVVDRPHAVAALEQQVDHVAADESGAAGHDRIGLFRHGKLVRVAVRWRWSSRPPWHRPRTSEPSPG